MNKTEEQLRKMLQGLTTSESMDLSQLLLNSPKTPPVRHNIQNSLNIYSIENVIVQLHKIAMK